VRFDVEQAMAELLQRGLCAQLPVYGEGHKESGLSLQVTEPHLARQLLIEQWDDVLWQRVRCSLQRVDALLED